MKKNLLNIIDGKVRLAEIMMVLSCATDLGMGQSMGWGLRGCLLAVNFAKALKVDRSQQRDVFYLSLLHYIGCTTDTHRVAEFFGNDLKVMRYFALQHMGDLPSSLQLPSPPTVIKEPVSGWSKDSNIERCETAIKLAQWCGFWSEIVTGLWQLFERWDGRGLPDGLAGEAISLPVRIVQIAQDAETFYRIGGVDMAVEVVKQRSNTGYDPQLAAAFCFQAPTLFESLSDATTKTVLDAEPLPTQILIGKRLERALEAIADFVDLKSPYTVGHSRGVAKIAEATAKQLGLEANVIATIRLTALIQDLGRISVANNIWDKPGSLTDNEWEQVYLHTYYTERIISKSEVLRPLGTLAVLHHERLDGSGYHRALPASMLSIAARILAVADTYQAMTEPRPYRLPLKPSKIAETLQQEALNGLDLEVVNATLKATGNRSKSQKLKWAGGLSQREVEVVRLIARGNTNRAIATKLNLSVKTVGHHVQHIYKKLNVTTRTAATLFAVQNDLLREVF